MRKRKITNTVFSAVLRSTITAAAGMKKVKKNPLSKIGKRTSLIPIHWISSLRFFIIFVRRAATPATAAEKRTYVKMNTDAVFRNSWLSTAARIRMSRITPATVYPIRKEALHAFTAFNISRDFPFQKYSKFALLVFEAVTQTFLSLPLPQHSVLTKIWPVMIGIFTALEDQPEDIGAAVCGNGQLQTGCISDLQKMHPVALAVGQSDLFHAAKLAGMAEIRIVLQKTPFSA